MSIVWLDFHRVVLNTLLLNLVLSLVFLSGWMLWLGSYRFTCLGLVIDGFSLRGEEISFDVFFAVEQIGSLSFVRRGIW